MPHQRNAGFVGRKALLKQIERALRPKARASPTVALTQAISGLGGIGKTQLAIEYVHRHAADYDSILWVLADPPATLATEYADLARAIGLPEATSTTKVDEQARAVRRWLESPTSGRWLLVFENAEGPEVLEGYLPTRHAGHVLITSRRSQWPGSVQPIEIHTLRRDESVKLLLGARGSPTPPRPRRWPTPSATSPWPWRRPPATSPSRA